MGGQGDRRRRSGFTRGSRRCGAAAFAASFGRKPYGAASCRARHPGDRPPAVPAVSRCARQLHDQTVILGPGARIAVKMSQPAGRNAAHCPDRPLHPQGHPKILSNRSAKTAPQKASSGPTLACGASADPAGLTARARPEARPGTRAANLSQTYCVGLNRNYCSVLCKEHALS